MVIKKKTNIMATIQFRRNLKYAHPKAEALEYIKTKLTLAEGEPLLCTYRESNGKWGSITIVCVYSKDNESRTRDTILFGEEYDYLFDSNGLLKENYIEILSNEKWENI